MQDFTASGEITYSWAGQQVQGSVTLRGRGPDQFRMDAVLPDGTRSWSASHGSGRLIKPDGTTESVPGHNAINLGSITFPYLWLAGASADSLTTVSSIGNAQVNGTNAVEIRVQRHYASSFDPNSTIAQLTTRDFFIDPASSLVLKVEFMTHPLKTFSVSLPEDIYFSNYQRVNGVMVPFSVSESINGQQVWSIQLSSIQFSSGLTDADFSMWGRVGCSADRRICGLRFLIQLRRNWLERSRGPQHRWSALPRQPGTTAVARSYSYDGLERETSETTPEAGTVNYYFTNSGGSVCAGDTSKVCRRTDARGITTTYSYDGESRLTKKSYSDSTPAAYFVYDESSVTLGGNNYTMTNGKGRLTHTSIQTNNAFTIESYDPAGRIQELWQCTPFNCASSPTGTCTTTTQTAGT